MRVARNLRSPTISKVFTKLGAHVSQEAINLMVIVQIDRVKKILFETRFCINKLNVVLHDECLVLFVRRIILNYVSQIYRRSWRKVATGTSCNMFGRNGEDVVAWGSRICINNLSHWTMRRLNWTVRLKINSLCRDFLIFRQIHTIFSLFFTCWFHNYI